jgi:hypothetical protein
MKKSTAIAIVLACLPLVGCVGGDDSIFARMGAGGGAAAGSSGGGGAAAGGGASGGQVAATGGAIAAGGGATTWIPGCTVAAGESWTKCQTTVDGQGLTAAVAPAAVPTVPSAQMEVEDRYPNDFSNIPGLQEVHSVASRKHCQDMLDKLRREGNTFHGARFYRSPQPGANRFGHCKLIGPSAVDNRFVDPRYDSSN